jgi:hypothetical protein
VRLEPELREALAIRKALRNISSSPSSDLNGVPNDASIPKETAIGRSCGRFQLAQLSPRPHEALLASATPLLLEQPAQLIRVHSGITKNAGERAALELAMLRHSQ